VDFHLPRFFISSIGYPAIDRAVAAPMRNEWAIVTGSDKLTITLRFSKTDQLGKVVNIEIPNVGGLMCPFESVSEYLTVRPTKDVPFLCHFSG
jgi:glycine cleavage system H lipoate-binding protein